jgi:hypothetical protein
MDKIIHFKFIVSIQENTKGIEYQKKINHNQHENNKFLNKNLVSALRQIRNVEIIQPSSKISNEKKSSHDIAKTT